MKNIIFTLLIASATSIAAASGAHLPAWNHANDSGNIPGLTAVAQPQGQRFVKYDRTEYIATESGIRTPGDIGYNDTHPRLRADK